jgi:hypothetical protein
MPSFSGDRVIFDTAEQFVTVAVTFPDGVRRGIKSLQLVAIDTTTGRSRAPRVIKAPPPDGSGNYAAFTQTIDSTTQNHQYRVRAYRSSDTSYSPYSAVCNNRRIYVPNNFRIFYGIRGTSDACPMLDGREVCLADVSSGGTNTYVQAQNTALQGSADAYARLSFARRADQTFGTLDKVPINIVWCDGGGCAGCNSGDCGLGLSPWLVEMPFDLVRAPATQSAISSRCTRPSTSCNTNTPKA